MMARTTIVFALYLAAWGAIRTSEPSLIDIAARISIPMSVFYTEVK